MYPDEQQINDLKLEIGLLKKDNEHLINITNKLSLSIDKIQEMNSNLLRMIALHDQKHESHVRTADHLNSDNKELHSRITTITRELYNKIDEVETSIFLKIENLRKDLMEHKQQEQKQGPLQILEKIENYKYLILGIVLATGFILGNFNTGLLNILFK